MTRIAVGPSLVCALGEELLRAQGPNARYDLLIRGGRVVDPSQGISGIGTLVSMGMFSGSPFAVAGIL